MGLSVLFSEGISSSSQEVFTTHLDCDLLLVQQWYKIIFDIYWRVRHSTLKGQSLSWLQEKRMQTRWMHDSKKCASSIVRARLYALGLHFLKLHEYEQYPSLSLLAQDEYKIESASLHSLLSVKTHVQWLFLSLYVIFHNKLLILQ